MNNTFIFNVSSERFIPATTETRKADCIYSDNNIKLYAALSDIIENGEGIIINAAEMIQSVNINEFIWQLSDYAVAHNIISL